MPAIHETLAHQVLKYTITLVGDYPMDILGELGHPQSLEATALLGRVSRPSPKMPSFQCVPEDYQWGTSDFLHLKSSYFYFVSLHLTGYLYGQA